MLVQCMKDAQGDTAVLDHWVTQRVCVSLTEGVMPVLAYRT